MSEHQPSLVQCSLVVAQITETHVAGDTIADTVRDQLLNLYQASGAVHLILDMQVVKYLSSAGIRPLLTMNKKVREREGRLILTRLTEEVQSVLLATRLISAGRMTSATFETHPDVTTSIASLYPAAG